MKRFEANNGNVVIRNDSTDTWLTIEHEDKNNIGYVSQMKVSLADMVFIRNCFDTIIKQETIEGDMLKPMVNTAVHNAMVKMECKIIPK